MKKWFIIALLLIPQYGYPTDLFERAVQLIKMKDGIMHATSLMSDTDTGFCLLIILAPTYRIASLIHFCVVT